MRKKVVDFKPILNDWDDSLEFIVGIGSFSFYVETPRDEEPKIKRRIGFINANTESKSTRRGKKLVKNLKDKSKQLSIKRG